MELQYGYLDVAKQNSEASEEVAKAVEDIANSASLQAIKTEEGSNNSSDLGEIIKSNANIMNSLNEANSKMIETIDIGIERIKKLNTISTLQFNLVINHVFILRVFFDSS